MRIKHFFGLAVLAAMTASCSSNNDLVGGGVMVQVRMNQVQVMLHSRLICRQQVVLVLQQANQNLMVVLQTSMQ